MLCDPGSEIRVVRGQDKEKSEYAINSTAGVDGMEKRKKVRAAAYQVRSVCSFVSPLILLTVLQSRFEGKLLRT